MNGGWRLSSAAAAVLLAVLLFQVSSLDARSDPATFDLPAWRPAPGDPIPFGKVTAFCKSRCLPEHLQFRRLLVLIRQVIR